MAAGWLGLVALVVLAMASAASADERVRVLPAALCHDKPLPEPTAEEMASEAAALLADASVVFRLVRRDAGRCPPDKPSEVELMVRVDATPQPPHLPSSIRAVGSIPFVGGRPLDTITLSVSAALYLMQHNASTAALLARVPQHVRQRWTGRMLGRALAHEVGHYLLRSPAHTANGLMRANHHVEVFVRPDRGAFRLTPALRERLDAAYVMHLLEP